MNHQQTALSAYMEMSALLSAVGILRRGPDGDSQATYSTEMPFSEVRPLGNAVRRLSFNSISLFQRCDTVDQINFRHPSKRSCDAPQVSTCRIRITFTSFGMRMI